eukprot:TRINITY_DN51171_c0_g1_i1.p1 TRINITY_DN51171_c0_g1~~TRINITY_DN51171_c0_g1_i1.p1  ORF type:complete len:350 (+),score=72.60 TRINITY_DN51171_c0_g1_i1:32-1081(+)
MPKIVVDALGASLQDGISKLQWRRTDAAGLPSMPSKGNVLVDVRAAAVNFPDLLMACGAYQYKPRLPYTPGTEACGVVLAVGHGVDDFQVGDKVIVCLQEGCMTSRLTAPALACTLLPGALSFAEGAAFSVAYTTAYHCLVERAAIAPQDVVLINGATGGVGLAAVEVARAAGCRVIIATGSSAEKLAVVRQHGATHCIDFSDPDMQVAKLGEMLKSMSDGRGVDVIYDPVGGETFDASLRGTAWGARVLIVGFASGKRPAIMANYALIKGLTIMGCRAGESVRRNPKLLAPRMMQLFRWVEEGQLRPHVSHTFSSEHVRDAFSTVLERRAVGKVVLTFDDPDDVRSKL